MPRAIPAFPATRPVELADRPLFLELFHGLQPTISEYSFGNLFLFRHVHRYALSRVEGSLVIFGCGYDELPYFLPPLDGDRGETVRFLLAAGHSLYGADERFVAEHLAGKGFIILADRDNDDYLYRQSDLAELPGNRFHKKKNRINYFAARHEFVVAPFSARHREGAQRLLDEWQRVHGDSESRSLAAEAAAAREALQFAAELGLSGVAIETGGTVAAFALGEQLNETTVVCHFEKTDPFLEGLAQLVNREFSRNQSADCISINRGQDLGESGLREAKSSYHPVSMVRKFRVTARH
jgi:hypothetical protein